MTRAVGLAVALLVLVPSIGRAQMDAGSFRALVTDSSGAVIPGATATLTNSGTGVARDVTLRITALTNPIYAR